MKKLLLSTILVLCGYLHADVSANQEVIAATNVVKSFAHDRNFGVSAQYIKNAKAVEERLNNNMNNNINNVNNNENRTFPILNQENIENS